jgi:hypothetical protein
MRISDIVRQLRIVFPKYSDVLSDTITDSFIGATEGEANIFMPGSPHGLTTGDPVVLQNFRLEVPIVSVTPGTTNTYYIETASDHDLSEGWHSTVLLDGFTDPDWDDAFSLVTVRSSTVFEIVSSLPGPVLTGNEILLANRSDGVNGYYSATVIGPEILRIFGDIADGSYKAGEISTNIRIAGAVDIARAVEQYTKQGIEDVWAFVVPNDVDVSKDMHTSSDATATMMRGSEEFRLRVIDGFTLYLIKSTKQDIGGVGAVDLFRHDLVLPILKSICGVKFPMGLTTGPDFRTVLRGHGVAQYNRAYLVYAYDFEQPVDIVDSDTAYDDDTRAFRELDYIHRVGGVDTEDAEAHIFFDDYMA